MEVKDIGIVLTLAELIVELVMKCFYTIHLNHQHSGGNNYGPIPLSFRRNTY